MIIITNNYEKQRLFSIFKACVCSKSMALSLSSADCLQTCTVIDITHGS